MIYRIVVVGDIHLRARAPRARKDDYAAAILGKLGAVGDVIRRTGAHAAVLLGDVFDAPDGNFSLATRAMEAIDQWGVPALTIAGNHDVYGGASTLYRTMLGHLIARERALRYVGDGATFELGEWIVTGMDYAVGAEARLTSREEGERWRSRYPEGRPVALFVHASITPTDTLIPGAIRPGQVAWPVQLLGCGHYHPGAPVGTTIGNGLPYTAPGALCRLAAFESDGRRQPSVDVVDLHPGGAASWPARVVIPHCPAEEVFDVSASSLGRASYGAAAFGDVVAGASRAMTADEAVMEAAAQLGAPPDVLQEALAALREAQQEVA